MVLWLGDSIDRQDLGYEGRDSEGGESGLMGLMPTARAA